MNFQEHIVAAAAHVPGLIRSALVLLPEGLLIGGTGAESSLDQEPLVRAATACLGSGAKAMLTDGPPPSFVEYAFVSEHELVVIQRGRSDARLVLAVVCTREPNLALVLNGSRKAIRALEGSIVVDELEP